MDGIWLEDGTFEPAKGEEKRIKGKSKGKGKLKGKFKGNLKGKGKGEDEPLAKKARVEENSAEQEQGFLWEYESKARIEEKAEDQEEEYDWEYEWKDKQICLVNLKTASLNGTMGIVKQYLGAEEVLVDGKMKTIRRFLVSLEGGKGEKSIKFENLFKVMTGALVKLRGLDTIELNDSIAECGKLDADTMRYDVTLSDGRHIKVKPANAEFYAQYETSQVGGGAAQMEWMKDCNSLRDRLWVIEEFGYPIPLLLPAPALEEYGKKFPKSVVIGKSNAANPKGVQVLAREVISASRVPPGSRIVFASLPRDRSCVAPPLADTRHDELLRLAKLAAWITKRISPRPAYFLLPGIVAKGPPSALTSAACAWPLYMAMSTDVVVVESERWKKSPWARLDALLAVWGRKSLYLLAEKYEPPIELPNAKPVTAESLEEDAQESAKSCPLSFRPEEPMTINRPADGMTTVPAQLAKLVERAAEAEGSGGIKVQCPTLAARRLC